VLGHPFVLEGNVGYGRGIGAKHLVPTANLELSREQVLPAYGVYTAWADAGAGLQPAVVSVGLRPTVVDDSEPVVEAYLLGWQGDLRGRVLALQFGTMLRPEIKYPSMEALQAAIAADVREAERWFAGRTPALAPAPRAGRD
jgi:riboflavin kinase / FMN adenylyltransferase